MLVDRNLVYKALDSELKFRVKWFSKLQFDRIQSKCSEYSKTNLKHINTTFQGFMKSLVVKFTITSNTLHFS